MTDHIQYGIHKYWVMNDGEVKHEDYVNDGIDQSNDFTWPHTCYTVNVDLLPEDLKNGDDEDLVPLILAYHHKEINKPIWIMEDIWNHFYF